MDDHTAVVIETCVQYLHPDDQEDFCGETARCAKCQNSVPYDWACGWWCKKCGRFFCVDYVCKETELEDEICRLCHSLAASSTKENE